MAKKTKEKNYWKIALISILVIWFLIFLFSPSEENKEYNENYEYELAIQEWMDYAKIINNDLKILKQYLDNYMFVQSASDISYLNAKIAPRLDILDLHLLEARQFLNQKGYLFSNGAELKAQIDEKIVNSQTTRNNINTFVDEYNKEIEEYNRKVQAYSELFKLLI